MCGICGIVSNRQSDSHARVARMLDRMAHRGPDGRGIWQSTDGRVTLGHVRLAIVDTSDAGAQPMHHPDGLTAVVNGEIYNYPELRRELEPSARFRSQSDSEVVLHGHADAGVEFLPRLNGMFAFGLFDERNGSMMLARDRLGIKPLYYVIHDGDFIFASEIKALFAAMDVSRWAIDPQALSEFLTYQCPLGDKTLFSGIKLLPPGSYLHNDGRSPQNWTETAFWSAQQAIDPALDFATASGQFDEVFARSVGRHLQSDVQVASYLSAGFDSAIVFASANRLRHQTRDEAIAGFTGYFGEGGAWYDETGPAGQLAKACDAPHNKVDIASHQLPNQFDDLIDALDEPRMGMGAFSQYAVAKAVAGHYKVVLTGHGGDELFAGYPVYAYVANGLFGLKRLSEAPHFAYFLAADCRKWLSPEQGRGLPVLWSIAQQAAMMGLERASLQPWKLLETFTEECGSKCERLLMTYLKAYLPGLLIVEDKISMAHSLESRTPILDNEMIDLSLSIPSRIKLQKGALKALIKTHAGKTLPQTYFDQPKRGFPTPLRFWFRGELANLVERRLASADSPLFDLLDADFVRQFVQQYSSSWRRRFRPLDEIQSYRMWQLLCLESWLRNWSHRYGVSLKLA